MTAQVAADLRAAADVLERDGWAQWEYHTPMANGTVCHCAQGAIGGAGTGDRSLVPDLFPQPWQVVRWEAANGALSKFVGDHVAEWNDEDHRTADEVIAALRAAADKADQS